MKSDLYRVLDYGPGPCFCIRKWVSKDEKGSGGSLACAELKKGRVWARLYHWCYLYEDSEYRCLAVIQSSGEADITNIDQIRNWERSVIS